MNENQKDFISKIVDNGWFKLLATLIIPIVIAVISYQLSRTKKGLIQAQIANTTEITNSLNMGDIQSVTRYKNREVEKLWLQNITISNAGEKTIIGIGNNKNIISDSNSIYFEYQNAKPLYIQNLNDRTAFPAQVVLENDKIKIYFEQWKEGEEIELSIFLETDKKTNMIELPRFGNRFIVDGENKVIQESETKSISYLDRIKNSNSTLYQTIRWISAILGGGFLSAYLILFMTLNGHFIPYLYWRLKYGRAFKNFITKDETISKIRDEFNKSELTHVKEYADKVTKENLLKYIKDGYNFPLNLKITMIDIYLWNVWEAETQKPKIKSVFFPTPFFFFSFVMLLCFIFICTITLLTVFP